MKFEEGQVVEHKISKEKFVIVRLFPENWFRSENSYKVSIGESGKKLKEEGSNDYIYVYEGEIGELKRKVKNEKK